VYVTVVLEVKLELREVVVLVEDVVDVEVEVA